MFANGFMIIVFILNVPCDCNIRLKYGHNHIIYAIYFSENIMVYFQYYNNNMLFID